MLQTYKNPKRRGAAEEGEEDTSDMYLGYVAKVKSYTITIPIDEGVKPAYYYRHVCYAIANAGEDDSIEFEISSPGGYSNGLIALLTAMQKTKAQTVAHINGECHSAASLLALNCDSIYVAPHSSMLVHFSSFGSAGKSTDVVAHVTHTHETSKRLFEETYKYFLTDAEIQRCIEGLELWLTSDEIVARLETKFKILESLNMELPEITTEENIAE